MITQVLAKKNYTDHVHATDESKFTDWISAADTWLINSGEVTPDPQYTIRHGECYRQDQCTGNKEKLDAAEIQSVNLLSPQLIGDHFVLPR